VQSFTDSIHKKLLTLETASMPSSLHLDTLPEVADSQSDGRTCFP